jgi:hypothetical protein
VLKPEIKTITQTIYCANPNFLVTELAQQFRSMKFQRHDAFASFHAVHSPSLESAATRRKNAQSHIFPRRRASACPVTETTIT